MSETGSERAGAPRVRRPVRIGPGHNPAQGTAGIVMSRVRVSVRSADPLDEVGLATMIGSRADLVLVPPGTVDRPDVLVMAATSLNAQVARQLRVACRNGTVPAVLIVEELGEVDLLAAVESGLRGVLRRCELTADRLARAVIEVDRGNSVLTSEVQSRLLSAVVEVQRTVLAPQGISACGLTDREIDVLRLIADGLDTAEAAERLNYSERTVRAVLHNITTRLDLRNRPHAIAYAMRAGVL